MTLSPFVFMYGGQLSCFDEASPCNMEQWSACVIDVTKDQSKYVPWLVCMDTKGETESNAEVCANTLGIDYSAVSSCKQTRGLDLINALVQHDSRVDGTPSTFVDNKAVSASYKAIKKALCAADSSLTACGAGAVAV